ncbi:hypothetical protein EJB05_01625, partial [Eragrostis curvula]
MGNSLAVRIVDCHRVCFGDNDVRGRDDPCFDLGGLNHVMTIQESDILVKKSRDANILPHTIICLHSLAT